MTRCAWIPLVAVVIIATPAPAGAQTAAELLDQAYDHLAHGRYVQAEASAKRYLANYPPRYKIAFIAAVSGCMNRNGSEPARNGLRVLKQAYALTPTARDEVDDWLNYCVPKTKVRVVDESPDDEVGVSSSSLTRARPLATSASSGASDPNRIPFMSPLVPATSFSGDDYAQVRSASAEQCSAVCLRQAPCRSMTYIVSAKVCWLKRSVPPAQPGGDFISARKILP